MFVPVQQGAQPDQLPRPRVVPLDAVQIVFDLLIDRDERIAHQPAPAEQPRPQLQEAEILLDLKERMIAQQQIELCDPIAIASRAFQVPLKIAQLHLEIRSRPIIEIHRRADQFQMPLCPAVGAAQQPDHPLEECLTFPPIAEVLAGFDQSLQFFEQAAQPIRLRHLRRAEHFLEETLQPSIEPAFAFSRIVFQKLHRHQPIQRRLFRKARSEMCRYPLVPILIKTPQYLPNIVVKIRKKLSEGTGITLHFLGR